MKRLLAVRNDKLGDLILALPALKIIKSSVPNIEIDFLINNKYSDIQLIADYIDNVICSDDELNDKIISRKYDYSISFLSSFDTGYKLWRSRIEKRYAPASKIAQIFYNKKIKQNRSESSKPEYQYNIDLAKYFLKDNSYEISQSNNPCISIKKVSAKTNSDKKLVFIHPFTGGSSKTLSCYDFIDLCKELNMFNEYSFVLHCDSNDYQKCLELEKKANGLDIKTISPTNNLRTMFENINQCDLFIAGSTGPLHVAASLNKKTVGFYPSKISSTLLRWDTVNDNDNKLAFSDDDSDDKYIKVDLPKTAELIYKNLLK